MHWKHIIHGNLWLHLTRKTPSSWSLDDQKQALTLLLSYHKFIITRPMKRSQCDNGCSINATTYISYLAKTVEQRQHCESDGSHCLACVSSSATSKAMSCSTDGSDGWATDADRHSSSPYISTELREIMNKMRIIEFYSKNTANR